MKREALKAELKRHPFFKEEEYGSLLVFKCPEERYRYYLLMENGAMNSPYPIGWRSNITKRESIFETPEWFQDLYIKANEFLFDKERNKIRKLINPTAGRHFANILFVQAVKRKSPFAQLTLSSPFCVRKGDEPFWNETVPLLEEEGYRVILLRETKQESFWTMERGEKHETSKDAR
jgi:hypothetical protein